MPGVLAQSANKKAQFFAALPDFIFVELRRLELLTLCMPCKCSTN